MSNTTRSWIVAVVVVLVIAGIVAWWYGRTPNVFPVSAADHLSSWTIPVNVDASSTATFRADIAKLESYEGTTTYPVSAIYVGIGNNYATLGDGKNAYKYYLKSLATPATSTEAVTYDNLGALFARLYATTTATRAYAQAVALNPTEPLFQSSYLNYLAQTAPNASSTAAAFISAKQAVGNKDPNVLVAEANWLEGIGSTTAAIVDWQAIRAQVSPAQQASVDAHIAQLRAQAH